MFDDHQFLMKMFSEQNTRALARVISLIENDSDLKADIMKNIFHRTGNAHVLGVTGSPGAGKSSLVDLLVQRLRNDGDSHVGIIAVDPTSPFSGGAILGDRIRMQNHATDRGVFIRSMGTRGSLGGLAQSTREVVKSMDAFGFGWVVVETVGVGQAELDIMNVADTTLVVLTPGAGDSIQAIKAGIMEIADVFVINKADLPGAERVAAEVGMMLDMQCHDLAWRPPVVLASTVNNTGIDELVQAIKKHMAYMLEKNILEQKRKQRLKNETLDIVNIRWQQRVRSQLNLPGKVTSLLEDVAHRKIDPYSAADDILNTVAEVDRVKL